MNMYSRIDEVARAQGDTLICSQFQTMIGGVYATMGKSGRQYIYVSDTGEVFTFTPDHLREPQVTIQAPATYTPAPAPEVPAPQTYKLGKSPFVADSRHFHLADYLDLTRLPTVPNNLNLAPYVKSPWGMDGNDTVGDCTCASAAHQDMIWSSMNGQPIVPTTDQCLVAYSAITGYNPSDPSTDQGAMISDVLAYWRKTGMPWGTKIGAYALLNRRDPLQVRQATYIFGGLHLGIQLPLTALDQTQNRRPWDLTPAGLRGPGTPGSWGGHDVPVVAYGPQGITVVTWGQFQFMTWRFFNYYVDEAWAIIPQEFMTRGNAPAGFNLAQLQADLSMVGTVQ